MCGRATLVDPNGIESHNYGFSRRFIPSDWKPRYNLNPREEIPAVHVDPDSGERVLRGMHWNFIPGHIGSAEKRAAFDAQYSTFNAKIERVDSAPSFRQAWRKQRCLVVVDGIIEWVGPKGKKIPHLIRSRGGKSFAMAGLWSGWQDEPGSNTQWSCAVVIGPSDDWYSRFHHRMALLLKPALYDAWLDPTLDSPESILRLLAESPFPSADELEAIPISRRVNNPSYDAPDCLEPAAEGATPAA